MPRKPIVNQDGDAWGTVLNEYLDTSHNLDGTLKDTAIDLAATTINAAIDRTYPATVGTDGQVLGKASGVPAWVAGGGQINVKDYGVVGDGATDDTIAIQQIFDGIVAQTIPARRVYFPQGTYRITNYLVPPRRNIALVGDHREASIIRQDTVNTPILRWQDEGSDALGLSTGIHIADLGLRFPSPATAAQNQQYAVQFRPSATGASVTHKGYLLGTMERCEIRNAYIGIGTDTDATGKCPLWGWSFRDIILHDCRYNAIKIRSGGDVGSTHLRFEQISVFQYGGVVPTGWAFDLWECSGVHVDTVAYSWVAL